MSRPSKIRRALDVHVCELALHILPRRFGSTTCCNLRKTKATCAVLRGGVYIELPRVAAGGSVHARFCLQSFNFLAALWPGAAQVHTRQHVVRIAGCRPPN